jgi:hypothetical protein
MKPACWVDADADVPSSRVTSVVSWALAADTPVVRTATKAALTRANLVSMIRLSVWSAQP